MFDISSITAFFGYPFFIRVVLPSIIWVGAMYPMTMWLKTHLFDERVSTASAAGILAAVAFILILVIDLLRSHVYLVYEGRSSWIPWARRKLQAKLARKVERYFQRAEQEQARQSSTYKETWSWLRMFPIGLDGKPSVQRPTLLGNVMAAYEYYPLSRYGMDSIFYWYRLWFKLPESIRKVYNLVSAEAQWLIYTSLALCISAIVYFAYFSLTLLARYFTLPFLSEGGFDSALIWPSGLLVLLSLTGSFLTYRLSIVAHRRVGEYFKSIFDDFRGELKVPSAFEAASERSMFQDAWAYLQYGLGKCPKCNQYYPAEEDKCPYCLSH